MEQLTRMGAETVLTEKKIVLPPVRQPQATFVGTVRVGSLLFVSGHGPVRDGSVPVVGQLGKEISVEDGYRVARSCGLALLATVKGALGSLDEVRRVVKVLGMVNSATGFGDQPRVMNGFSDLMVEVFGDAGRHARSAVGMAALPHNMPVEVEAIFEVG